MVHIIMVHIIKFGGKRELSCIDADMRHRQTNRQTDQQTNRQTNRPTDQQKKNQHTNKQTDQQTKKINKQKQISTWCIASSLVERDSIDKRNKDLL